LSLLVQKQQQKPVSEAILHGLLTKLQTLCFLPRIATSVIVDFKCDWLGDILLNVSSLSQCFRSSGLSSWNRWSLCLLYYGVPCTECIISTHKTEIRHICPCVLFSEVLNTIRYISVRPVLKI
jgi:hypothetical protein